ncbi:MAG: hypothetical protein HYW05_05285 [Candidatus Diapherotrites archaeon]|nr:hypothetical protein [Candidatus Diapherotrites archaeon]
MSKIIAVLLIAAIAATVLLSGCILPDNPPIDLNAPSGLLYGFKLENTENSREISENAFKLAAELNINYVLVPIKYPERGAINASARDLDWSENLDYYYIFELANKYDVSVMPAFYKLGGKNDKDAEKYAEFVVSFIDEFYGKRKIDYIEFQNEPIKDYDGKVSARFKGTPADLAKSNTAAYRKVKEKYPSIEIGTAGFMASAVNSEENIMMNNYYEEYFSAGAEFDFLALHFYPKNSGYLQTKEENETAYNFLSEYEIPETYRKLLDDFGYDKRAIFITEGDVAMPSRGAGQNWLEDDETAILLAERLALASGKSGESRIIGLFASGIHSQSAKKAGYYKMLLEFAREYPNYSKHIAGEINSEHYWIEEFKDENGKRMWLAFNPLLFWAEAESPENLRAIATGKSIASPQEMVLDVGRISAVKISSLSATSTVEATNGMIILNLGKEPVFIEELE